MTVWFIMIAVEAKTNTGIVFCMSENPSRSILVALNNQEGLETELMTKKTPVTLYPTKKSHMQNHISHATIVLSVSDYPCGLISPL